MIARPSAERPTSTRSARASPGDSGQAGHPSQQQRRADAHRARQPPPLARGDEERERRPPPRSTPATHVRPARCRRTAGTTTSSGPHGASGRSRAKPAAAPAHVDVQPHRRDQPDRARAARRSAAPCAARARPAGPSAAAPAPGGGRGTRSRTSSARGTSPRSSCAPTTAAHSAAAVSSRAQLRDHAREAGAPLAPRRATARRTPARTSGAQRSSPYSRSIHSATSAIGALEVLDERVGAGRALARAARAAYGVSAAEQPVVQPGVERQREAQRPRCRRSPACAAAALHSARTAKTATTAPGSRNVGLSHGSTPSSAEAAERRRAAIGRSVKPQRQQRRAGQRARRPTAPGRPRSSRRGTAATARPSSAAAIAHGSGTTRSASA